MDRLVSNTFKNFKFKNYKISPFIFTTPKGKRVKWQRFQRIKTSDTKFIEQEIELEPLALSLLKVDLNRPDEEISKEFTEKWGFLDFKQKFYAEQHPSNFDGEPFNKKKFISEYKEECSLWKTLSYHLHYLFYLQEYSFHHINNIFIDNEELPNHIFSEEDINNDLSMRVSPSLGFKKGKLESISLQSDSLFGAVLIFAIDNFYRELRQCKGPNCRKLFFVKRKGRMFCEPNGRCAKAFERLNKKSKAK